MARHHKKTKKTMHRRRRSRVGALDKGLLTEVAGAIGGYVIGNMIGNNTSLLPTLDPKIKGAAVAAIGVMVVPRFMKSPIGKGIGIGMATAGSAIILKNLGVISGVMSPAYLPYPSQRRIAGSGINAMVNGSGINAMVNGSGINKMVNGSGINKMVNGRYNNAMKNAMKYGG